jgi:tetratricopeptide (TPR) repeat protein
MQRAIPILFLGLLSRIACPAQDLVRYEELTFTSEFEKKLLDDHFLNHKTDLFMLFMASGTLLREPSIEEAKTRFYNHLGPIKASKLAGKKNDKKVKFIYEDIHSTFLNKYELKNQFEDIFINGYYNCVSASALYGLALEYLEVPYSIKEKPTHVYLVAYPDTEQIMVETTTPIGGFVTINQPFKQNYVKVLKDQKVISAQEYATGDTNDLFDKFYYGSRESISLLQLLGLQYLNEGVFNLEEKKYPEALQQIEKGYMFYPSERGGYLFMAAVYEAFKARAEKDLVHAGYLSKLARCEKYGITPVMVKGEFARVVDVLLFDKGQKEKLAEYYNQFHATLQDKELANEIKLIYNFENGRLLYNQARFRESIPFFKECLEINPNHQETNQIFISAVAQSVKNKSNPEILKNLEDYAIRYPMLLQNNIFNEMMGSTYLSAAEIGFKTNQPVEGEKYKSLFETFHKAHDEVSYNTYQIGQAYSAAAVYYFRKGQTSKAKSIIAKGLELSPDNYELLTRKKMIE